jgi:hypothetical protein
MMAAPEQTDKNSSKKIVAFDGQDKQVVEFSAIPFRKRFFLVGMWPWQKYFSEFAKYVYWEGYQPFYSKHLNAIFHFKELKADTIFRDLELAENIRVIAVLDEHKNKPIVVILTNQTQMSAEDLAQAFILRWPNLDQGPAGNIFQRINFMQYSDNISVANALDSDTGKEYDRDFSVEKNILSLSYDFGQMLRRCCREQFFRGSVSNSPTPAPLGLGEGVAAPACRPPAGEAGTGRDFNPWGPPTGCLESIYSHIAGHCMRLDNVRHIILSPRSDHPNLREIKRAVLTINESAITDFDGYLIFVQCDVKEIR